MTIELHVHACAVFINITIKLVFLHNDKLSKLFISVSQTNGLQDTVITPGSS